MAAVMAAVGIDPSSRHKAAVDGAQPATASGRRLRHCRGTLSGAIVAAARGQMHWEYTLFPLPLG